MPKILAIDDKEDNLISLSAVLKSLIPGCIVITARSGPEGIEKAKIESPDTVLLDIKMPGMDGYEICKRLKEDKDTRHIPVIMISAILTGSQDLIKGLDTGADAYLTKPVDEQILIAQVKTALRMKAAEDSLRGQKDLLEEMVRERTAALANSNVHLKREIDERKKADETLKESEKKYRSLFEQSNDAIIIHDLNGDIIDFNQRALDLLGYDHEQLLNMTIAELHPEEELASSKKAFQETSEKGDMRFETRFRRPEGTVVDVEISSRIIDSVQKGIVQGIIRDITERKNAEKALLKSEEQFRTIFEQSPYGIALIGSLTGRIYEVNPKFAEIAGRTLEEMTTIDWMRITHPDDVQEDLDNLVLLNAGEISGFNMKKRYIRPDGSHVWINMTIAPVKVEDKTHPRHLCMIEDITANRKTVEEKERLEAQLQQAQKMEAIGTLAGGIAHDFNNILFPLMGYSEMLREDLPTDSSLQGHVDEILRAALRARDLVKQILEFSRQGDQNIKPIKLQPIVKEVLKLLRSSIPTTIDIQQDIDPDCGVVVADPTQIHQIVMNLATNAYHAMEETGGILKVSLKQERLKSEQALIPELLPGEYALLTVADTGTGIEKDVMDKIYDPYFTTKETGKGTGLGLSVVQGIIKSCNGDIRIYSEPGKGTEIKVYLPTMDRKIGDIRTDRSEPILGGTEKILLVDDEEAIVRMEQQVLERLGYRVTTRTGSVEALETFKANPDSFDLVVTDMTMPNMTGVQLAGKIKKIRSDILVILCTGFSYQINDEKSKALGIQGFVMKPVVIKEIAKTIRKVLDNSGKG